MYPTITTFGLYDKDIKVLGSPFLNSSKSNSSLKTLLNVIPLFTPKITHHPTNKKPNECGDNSTMNISHL